MRSGVGPAPAVGEGPSLAWGQPNSAQSVEPAVAATATSQALPAGGLAGPANLPIARAPAGVPAEGALHPTGGLVALHSRNDDNARASGAPLQQSRITLRANADTWIQIRVAEHSVLFTGVLKPGDIYRVPDLAGLTMRAGNAGGLDVTVDGKPASPLGPMGAVRNLSLSPQSLTEQSAVHD